MLLVWRRPSAIQQLLCILLHCATEQNGGIVDIQEDEELTVCFFYYWHWSFSVLSGDLEIELEICKPWR